MRNPGNPRRSRAVLHAGALGLGVLAFGTLQAVGVLGGSRLVTTLADWVLPVMFVGCGLACLLRASAERAERRPWQLIGGALLLYASGSVVYNIALGSGAAVGFPSLADALWLLFYPLAFAGVVLLVRARHPHASASLWLDGLIGGTVVVAVHAVFVIHPVLEIGLDDGVAGAALLAYPTFDLLLTGFAVVLWGVGGWRLDSWLGLAAGFALIGLSDTLYLVAQANGGWEPGTLGGIGYGCGTLLLAAAAWRTRKPTRPLTTIPHVGLPVAFTVSSLALVSYEAFVTLDAFTVVTIRLTLLAVVLRLCLTLWWLSRQRGDLEALAASDPLTGLGNYRAFQEQLEAGIAEARAEGSVLSVVALDLDHFKAVNDTYGHAEGDKTLQATALALARNAREGDLVARVGGEEFALIVKGADAAGAVAVAERCRASLANLDVSGRPLSCSAGVACFPAHGQSPTQVLESADGALYWAKRSGRNRTRLYDPRRVVPLSLQKQRRELEALLASASPVAMVFQPLMEVATGRVAGYEALARFEAPFEGPPQLWFAQAHRCGLGPALEACAVRAALAVAGRPEGTFLTVNISPAALLSPEVQEALPQDLGGLVIELTEHEAFGEDGALELQLGALRHRGARIALDDAGAGHAGLQQLIRIRPDLLKIDRSLIANIHQDASKLALLEVLVRFATATGAAVCAEGVEELAELQVLAGFDVTYAQGYALARPGPPWGSVNESVAGCAAASAGHGMRVVGRAGSGDGPSLGELTDVLGRVATLDELNEAIADMTRLLDVQEIALSRVDTQARRTETLSRHDWARERSAFDDYPATTHVIEKQVIGQVIAGDPASDPAELQVLEEAGMESLLLVPVVFDRATIALLEIYRRDPRPWTAGQVDQVRALANHLAACLTRLASAAARA